MLVCIYSCVNIDHKVNEDNTVHNTALESKNTIINCRQYKHFFDSIPYEEKLDIKVNFENVKCQLTEKVDMRKYNYLELLSKYNYKEFDIYLYRFNCIAGGGCGDYFMSVISRDLEVLDSKIIASEVSEGENNTTIENFNFNKGQFSFNILTEYYSEELDNYIENIKSKVFVITDSGKVTYR